MDLMYYCIIICGDTCEDVLSLVNFLGEEEEGEGGGKERKG